MRAEAFVRPMHSIGWKNILLSGVIEMVAGTVMIYEAAVLSFHAHECVYVGLGQPDGQIYERSGFIYLLWGRL